MKNKKNKSVLNFLLLIAIASLVLYFSLKDNYEQIINEILGMNIIFVMLAFLFIIIYWLIRSIIIKNLATSFKSDYSLKEANLLVLRTNFFHAVTPFSTGGQPYEIYSLKKSGLKLVDSTNVSIQNFIVYQISLVLLGLFAIMMNYFFHIFKKVVILQKLVTLGFIINTLVVVILFLVTFGGSFNKKIFSFLVHLATRLHLIKNEEEVISKSNNYFNDFYKGAKILLQDKSNFIKLIIYQLISFIFLYSIPLMLMYATNDFNTIGLLTAVTTSAYVMLIGSFVPIPGGTGGLEYGFIAFYSTFISSSRVRAIMLVWRFVTYYFGMIVGAIALTIRKK